MSIRAYPLDPHEEGKIPSLSLMKRLTVFIRFYWNLIRCLYKVKREPLLVHVSGFFQQSLATSGIILTQKFLRENDLIQLKFMRNSPFSVRILGTFHY